MNEFNLKVDRKSYSFDATTLRDRLLNVRNTNGTAQWIRADLTMTQCSSTRFGRIMRVILKHLGFFPSLNLAKTRKILEALYPQLNDGKHAELYEIYKDAVASFEMIAPHQKLFSKNRPTDFLADERQKQLQFDDLVCSSQGMCTGPTSLSKVKKVFSKIKENQPEGIEYNSHKISNHISGGNCTALSLDFLKKYLYATKTQVSSTLTEKKKQITEVGKLYKRGGADVGRLTEFRSQQAAFNCIEVKKDAKIDFSRAKVQSLINFHDFQIGHDSGCFDIRKDSLSLLDKKIEELPEGAYLLRVIKPNDNERLEEHGHSMVFIRAAEGDFFYDPNLGTEYIEKFTSQRLFWHLKRNWNKYQVSETRFYQMVETN